MLEVKAGGREFRGEGEDWMLGRGWLDMFL